MVMRTLPKRTHGQRLQLFQQRSLLSLGRLSNLEPMLLAQRGGCACIFVEHAITEGSACALEGGADQPRFGVEKARVTAGLLAETSAHSAACGAYLAIAVVVSEWVSEWVGE